MTNSNQHITEWLHHFARISAIADQGGPHPDSSRAACDHRILATLLEVEIAAGDCISAVSEAQRGMWFLQRMEPDTLLYNYTFAYRLQGKLEVNRLKHTLETLVTSHEALRTTFHELNGEPIQLIHAERPTIIHEKDLSTIPPKNQEALVAQAIMEERRQRFDLARGPLVRFTLYQGAPDVFYLSIHWHHLIMDGKAIANFWEAFASIYETLGNGTSPFLTVPQPADIALAQRTLLQGEFLTSQLAYWQNVLEQPLPRLDLPLDKPRPARQSHEGKSSVRFRISPDNSLALKQLADQAKARSYTTVLAAFYILLYRYTGQEDLVVGFPAACRKNPPAREVIGHFVNLLPLRLRLHGKQTYREILADVRDRAEEGLAHQFVPVDRIVQAVNPPRVMDRGSLFDAIFAFQSIAVYETAFGGITVHRLETDLGMAHADLLAWVEDRPDGFYGAFDFCTDLFEKPTMDAMATAYAHLLATLAQEPDTPIDQLTLMSPESVEWACCTTPAIAFPAEQTLTDLVSDWAMRDPERPAVGNDCQSHSYASLDRWITQIAYHLQQEGAEPEQTVVLALESGPELIAAVLGTLKAGCAFLAFDMAYPAERLAFMMADADCRFVLTTTETAAKLPAYPAKIICLDTAVLEKEPTSPLPRKSTPSSLAYLIYTSGSTGRPKGVGIEHAGLTHFACWLRDHFPLNRGERVLQFASPSFDAFVLEMAWAMASGAELRFVDWETRRSPEQLAHLLRKERIAGTLLPPALLRLMPTEGLDALRLLLTGGDVCSTDLVARWAPGRLFYNAYGPSECTVAVTVHPCSPHRHYHSVPIGRAIPDTRLYVVDTHLHLVPPGMPGELCIAGVCVGRGYRNRPELTAERFATLAHGERVYRTGDRVRFLPDGELEFLGRTDWQVKVRGFRIELEEIEAVLRKCPGVQDAVVSVVNDISGEKQIAAYLVAPKTDFDTIRNTLRGQLPSFMIPAVVVPMETLPLAASGKVDRNALPHPVLTSLSPVEKVMRPRTTLEMGVAACWEDVLKTPAPDISEHFFDCGGSSLLLVQLVARLNREFSVSLSIREAFENPTITALAQAIARLQTTPAACETDSGLVVALRETGSRPPLFLFPPAGGVNTAYYALGRELGEDQPVYLFHDPCVLRNGEPCKTLEEAARYYADAIRAIQPEGCCYVMGWSFGATMALETAQTLGKQYGYATCTFMLDPAPGLAAKRSLGTILRDGYDILRACVVMVIPSMRETWDHAFVLVSTERRKQMALKRSTWRSRWRSFLLGIMWNTVLKHADVGKDVAQEAKLALIEQPNAKAFRRIMRANLEALIRYQPQTYSGRLVLLQAEEQAKERMVCRFTRTLEALTQGGVERHRFSGHHYSLLRRPNVIHLARIVRQCMDDGQAKQE